MSRRHLTSFVEVQQYLVANGRWINRCYEWQQYTDPNGYGRVRFQEKSWLVHRLFWVSTFGSISPNISILHRCNNRLCFAAGHLYAGSYRDNAIDRVSSTHLPNGSKGYNTKLTEKDVRNILAIYNAYKGKLPYGSIRFLAETYNISRYTIRSIFRRETWKHLNP